MTQIYCIPASQISGFGESLSLKDGSCHQLNPNFELSVEWTAPEVGCCWCFFKLKFYPNGFKSNDTTKNL